jgi:hypothetical protein
MKLPSDHPHIIVVPTDLHPELDAMEIFCETALLEPCWLRL